MRVFTDLNQRFTRIPFALLALALMSCGGDSATAPDDGDSEPRVLAIGFAESSARPGEEVAITGIPPSVDLSGVHAVVNAGAASASRAPAVQTTTSTALVARRADGTPYFVAPLFPPAPAGGGSVEILLAGGGVTSNAVAFTIESLPPATITVRDMVDQLQALLSSWLTVHGTTRDALRAMDPATMPAFLYPLWHAHEVLDSPDNPNSLRALVDGPIPFFENETIDFDVADRLLSEAGVVPFLVADVVSIDSLTALEPLPLAPAEPRVRSPLPAVAGVAACNIPAGNYGITTAGALDIAMTKARAAASRIEGATGDVLNLWGNAATTLAVVPTFKAPASAVGAGIYVFKSINEAAARLLPTTFDYGATDFEIDGNDVKYNEDDTGGFWRNFRVTAVSQGWVLDEFALQAILRVAKFKDFGGFDSEVPVGHMSDFEKNLRNFVITAGTKVIIGESTDGANLLEVCPGTWPNIDVSSAVFSESEIAFGTSFAMSSHTFFETREPGISELKVQTLDTRFGGAPPASESKTIEVIGIEVVVTPASVTMEPGEVQTFDALVKNASDDRVDWIVPAPLVEVSRTNNGKTIVVQAPPAEQNWTTPVSLVARSLANTGAREGKVESDPREGGAVIAPLRRAIVVTPRADCIGNGETRLFTAAVTGVDNPVVRWSVAVGYGTINETTGLYRAPNIGTTDDVILAEVVGEEDLTDYANIRVGACECYFEITVGGASVWRVGGSAGHFSVFGDGESGIIQWQFVIPNGPDGQPIPGSFTASYTGGPGQPIPGPGDTGQYSISAAYIAPDGIQSWTATQGDTAATLTLDITESTSTSMEGTMSGVAVQRTDPEDSEKITSTVFITVSFRVGYWNFGGPYPCD